MPPKFTVGDIVQTRFGKGEVRELRNNRRLLIDVHGRAVVFTEAEVTPVIARAPAHRSRSSTLKPPGETNPRTRERKVREIDLHGLTVEAALSRVEAAMNEALLADAAELRIIHGRSGGRIKAALHRLLKQLSVVRSFRIDPRNAGVTIATL